MEENKNEEIKEEKKAEEPKEHKKEHKKDKKLEELQNEVNTLKDKNMRIAAEMVNTLRRKDEETNRLLKYSNESLITELLPVIDNFERALNVDAKTTDIESYQKGMTMIYNSLKNILEKFEEREITYISKEEFEVNESEYSEYPELNPTVQLKLNSMDLKELRKAFNENEKAIKQTLERYESRYTTKTNATIYKLMVIALKAEQQNILYNLKYDKLEKSIEDVKKLTDKYMKIAMDGNQSIVSTMRKFIGEIEYEYYVQKEKQREEQAKLREQMKQEAEEKKLLEQQKKQIEKEEGKYQTEIEKVEEIINSTEDEEKLNKLQEKI